MTTVIAVTGRAGSGKSQFQKIALGFPEVSVIDLDHLGHDALKLPEVKNQLMQLFGTSVFDDYGEISRKALGALVFNNLNALSLLNRVSHPIIFRLATERISACKTSCCLIVGALIKEIGLLPPCQIVVVIDAEDELIQRVAPKQVSHHSFQRSRNAFLALADIVIINTFDSQFEETSRRIMSDILEAQQKG